MSHDTIPNIIQRAFDAGVAAMQNISTTLEESRVVIEQSTMNDAIYASVGIHPCNTHEEPNSTKEDIIQACNVNMRKVIGIGETGLDYYHKSDPDTIELQKRIFEQHIYAACELGKPLIVHTRDAEDDTYEILKSHQGLNPKILIHCFTGSKEFMHKILDIGGCISFSGIVTFKNALALQECAKEIPLDRMIIETDSPYLAPTPLRGKPNEPSYIKHTAEFLAKLKGVAEDVLKEQTTRNFCDLFSVSL